MTIDQKNLSELTQDDLQDLVTGQVSENIRLEYKRDLYGQNDNSKKELLKDVSALANSQGGHLIIGIEEFNGRADALYGVRCDNPDDETLRMEQVIRSGIEPNIASIRIRYIKLTNHESNARRYLFIISIPQSSYPPHRVIINNHNRFYLRNSAGVHEPDIEELRAKFATTPAVEISPISNAERQANQIHPLNLYGFLLNAVSLILLWQTNAPDLSRSHQWFVIGIALHCLHAVLASLNLNKISNVLVTYYIQICILSSMLLGFVSLITGWILSGPFA